MKHDGLIVSILDGAMTCFIHESEVGRDSMLSMTNGQDVKAAITHYNQEIRKLSLSVSRVYELSAANSSSSKLGDMMGN